MVLGDVVDPEAGSSRTAAQATTTIISVVIVAVLGYVVTSLPNRDDDQAERAQLCAYVPDGVVEDRDQPRC